VVVRPREGAAAADGVAVVHVAGQKHIGEEQRLVVQGGHQRVGARVGVLDTDLNRVILGEARRADLLLRLCAPTDAAASGPDAAAGATDTAVRQLQAGHALRYPPPLPHLSAVRVSATHTQQPPITQLAKNLALTHTRAH
jgi:hypothetical protein